MIWDKLEEGCERYCEFHPQMGRKPVVKERVIQVNRGQSYLIDFYEFRNFPMTYMFIELGVHNKDGQNSIYAKCWFQAKPKIVTKLFRGKMKKTLLTILLGYKHYMETGERNTSMKTLLATYHI